MSTRKFNLRCGSGTKHPLQEIKIFLIEEDWGVKIQANSNKLSDTLLQLWNDGRVFVDPKGAELFNLRVGYLETKK